MYDYWWSPFRLDKMMDDGLSEDDAISVMVDVWAKNQGINVIYRNEG